MEDYDAYHLWLGIPPDEQPPSHYRLLGVKLFEQNIEVIRNAADRQRSHVKRLGVNQFEKLGQDLLNQIEMAKICLLRPEKRQVYDENLRQELQRRDAAGHGSTYEEQLTEETLIIGSDRNCDIVVDMPTISGIHCSVMRRKDRVVLRDLKSLNGTFLNFSRVVQPARITPSDLIVLGRDRRLKLPIAFFPPALRGKRVGIVGRSDQCEIRVPDPMVSSFHARIVFDGEATTIEDLGSLNGTSLIDSRGRPTKLRAHSPTAFEGFVEIAFGKHKFPIESLREKSCLFAAAWNGDTDSVLLDG